MGTRADYYIAECGGHLRWLGSTGQDGHPRGLRDDGFSAVLDADSRLSFVNAVRDMLAARADSAPPEDGWPWPWNDSTTTDYAYVFRPLSDGSGPFLYVDVYTYGAPWEGIAAEQAFPDMSDIKRIVWGRGLGPAVISGGWIT